jgi:hypothetical protein
MGVAANAAQHTTQKQTLMPLNNKSSDKTEKSSSWKRKRKLWTKMGSR